ncbi:MAG TPA: fused MFS/spermidine synthase [Candidatus Nitrosotenuis sp.]
MWKYVDVGDGEKIFHKIDEFIFSKNTKYQLLEIVKTRDFGNVLFLDGDPQSSEIDEHVFNECLVHPSMVSHSKPKTVFIGGGGTGLTLREVLRHSAVERVDIVDIDKEVVDTCKRFYNYAAESFSDPRTKLYHEDARQFLSKTDSSYDCIFLDTTMPHHEDIAAPLYRKEFFEIVSQKLKPDGIFATAANSADFRHSTRFASVIKTLQDVFAFVTPYVAYAPLFGQDWAFVTASNVSDPSELKPQEINRRLVKNGCGELNFYDGITHQRIFSLDKKLRNLLDETGHVLTDSLHTRDEIFVPELPESRHFENYVNLVDLTSYSNLIKVANGPHKTF